MFKVRTKNTGELYTVYAASKPEISIAQAYFLIYRYRTWEWVPAIKFKPEGE